MLHLNPGDITALVADAIVIFVLFVAAMVLEGKRTRWRFVVIIGLATAVAKFVYDLFANKAPNLLAHDASSMELGVVYTGVGLAFLITLWLGFVTVTTKQERQMVDAQASEEVNIELARRQLRNVRRRPGGLP